jgi:hypothetical protein
MRLPGIALLAASAAFGQTIMDPARIPGLVRLMDPQPGDKALRCEVTPIHPSLNYTFRFQAGFVVRVPMDQYLGPNHRWLVVARVTPEGGSRKPVYLASSVRLPDVPKTNVELPVAGGYLVGAGRYQVKWLLLDDTGRVCRSAWDSDARLMRSEIKVQVAMPPDTVAEFSLRGTPDPQRTRADAPAMRVTILLHAAALSPRRAVLNGRDQVMLLGTLSSLLERLPARSVRLVLFNLEQQRVLLRDESFTLDGLDRVAQSLNDLQLGRVDVSVLENRRGHEMLLADMLNQELTADPVSDVVIFLGPRTRFVDKFPANALEKTRGGAPRFFDLQVRPFFFTVANVPDLISHAVAKLKGKTISLQTPGEFARAIEQVIAHAPPPSRAGTGEAPVRP